MSPPGPFIALLDGRPGVVELGQMDALQGASQQEFYGLEVGEVRRGQEADCRARRARPRRPSDAVDVVAGVERDVVVDHVRDAFHVQTALGDVGGHQDAHPSRREAVERPHPMAHLAVGVHDIHRDALALEPGEQHVGAALGAGEDKHLVPVRVGQEPDQQIRLLPRLDGVHPLVDSLRGRSGRRHLDAHRVAGDLERKRVNAVRHGRREEHRLALPGHPPEDALDLRAEAHVEHAIGLVQDQEADPPQIRLPAAHVIDEAPRGGGDQFRAGFKRGALRPVAHPAHDGGAPQGSPAREGNRVSKHLLRQFAGGAEHKRLKTVARDSAFQHGEEKGPRLARPGLCDADDVPALQPRRNRPALHRGRLAPAQRLHGGEGLGG